MMKKIFCNILLELALAFAVALPLCAEPEDKTASETSSQGLGKKLQNPVANLIRVPFENDFETGLGPGERGFRYKLYFEPVMPTSLNNEWLLILRPIVPFFSQHDAIRTLDQSSLGDIELEPFISPKHASPDEIMWGAGPILLFPTASDERLGSEKFGIGPNVCVLKQTGPWTAGLLTNHTWSYAGNHKREDISATYLQPFTAHTSAKGLTLSVSSESTYDWEGEQWTVPLIGGASQILKVYGNFISIGVFGIYYAEAPPEGPQWGVRITLTFIYPSK